MIEKLFTSKNRVKILGFIFFEKNKTYLREIASKLKISPNAVKREIENLNLIGILNKKDNEISLNERCPFLEELKNIFIKTDYIVYPLFESLKNNKIKFAFIFGSFANKKHNESSDVDLFIIGDVKREEIFKVVRDTEKKVERDINPIVWTIDALKEKKEDSFFKDLMKKPKIFIIGGEDGLRKIIE